MVKVFYMPDMAITVNPHGNKGIFIYKVGERVKNGLVTHLNYNAQWKGLGISYRLDDPENPENCLLELVDWCD